LLSFWSQSQSWCKNLKFLIGPPNFKLYGRQWNLNSLIHLIGNSNFMSILMFQTWWLEWC
jgi:hypothetical protein